jgi:hypothetical protein
VIAAPPRPLLGLVLVGACVGVALGQQGPGNGDAREPPVDSAAASDREGVLEAVPVTGEIRLDGVLDEPAWAGAPAAGGFRQQEPDEGSPATLATTVRVLYTADRLYIGARMEDPEPERLLARILERDALVEQGFLNFGSDDDALFVVLDTYDDGRNGFLFATNPNGAETDALLRNENDLNLSWDAVWSVATSVDGDGWTAEIAIPFWTLRFSSAPAQRWGLNVQRVIKRRNEYALWRSWSRDNGGLLKVSQAGSLVGLSELRPGLNLQVKPFALAAGRQEASEPGFPDASADTDGEIDVGLDVKYGVTSNLTLDATVNTDFAQVEADVRQINLTRFDLFFPEKREFFLEGAGIFDVGVPGFGGPPSLLLFFSRRIGLAEGREVPILGGVKLTGKEGPWTIGALDVLTDEEELPAPDPLGGPGGAGDPTDPDGESDAFRVLPLTNFAVARVVRDVGARSTVGLIATHRAEEGGRGAGAYAADVRIQPSQQFVIDAFLAGSDTPAAGAGSAWRTAFDFTADTWGWFLQQLYVGDDFDPPVGFVIRDDINRQTGSFRVSPRPDLLGLRRVDLRVSAELISSAGWQIRDREYQFAVEPQLDAGDGGRLAVRDEFRRLVEPFVLAPDVVFPEDDYATTSWEATAYTSRNRVISGEVRLGRFGFFSGRNVNVGGDVTLAASRNLSLEASWDHNEIASPHGDLVTDLAAVRVNYAFSTRFFTNALIQYDSFADAVDANVRLNLIHSPGSDLFIVLNELRGEPGHPLRGRDRALVVKFTKLLHF